MNVSNQWKEKREEKLKEKDISLKTKEIILKEK